MNYSLGDRLSHAWNAFTSNDRKPYSWPDNSELFYGPSYGYRQDKSWFSFNNGKDFVAAIYNQLGVDIAAIPVRHVKLNDEGHYLQTIQSGLNNCLTVEANIDQTGRAFMQDCAMTLFDEGVIAIVPIETTLNPEKTGGYDVKSLRVGKVMEWYPKHVRVNVYNENKGIREEITLQKSVVAIVENPLYTVMNEPSGTLKRLMAKLALMDSVDGQLSSGKLDIIIQLPYVVKTEERRLQAEKRRKDIEMQLTGSKYGIAYTDGTEKITQLNRPAENNLLEQIDKLTEQLFSQLGLTMDVFNGTADEKTMLNYYNRTIEPVLSAIVDSMHRTFLTKTARTQKQAIRFYRDPFRYMPMSDMAETAEKFIRNRVTDPNEIRARLGIAPHDDPAADHLQNPNIDVTPTEEAPVEEPDEVVDEEIE